MYKFILNNDETLYLPGDEECVVKDPEISLTLNEAGSLKFKLPPKNPYYDSLHMRQSMVTVYRDDEEVFCGEVRENKRTKNRVREIYCAGELSFLHNSRQPQFHYGAISPGDFLYNVLANHNRQVEERQQFTAGMVSVAYELSDMDFIVDHDDTLEVIRNQVVDALGGVLRIRKVDGVRYLDIVTLEEYGGVNSQGVTFGENLMEYADTESANNVVTAIIPRGEASDDNSWGAVLKTYVSIRDVNDGYDYIVNESAVSSFGYIWDVVDFPDITDPATLKAAAENYLSNQQYADLELTLTAADLSQLDSSMEAFRLGDRVPVYAEPYGMDRTFPVKSLTLYPQAPQNERLKLSEDLKKKSTFTASSSKTTERVANATGTAAHQDTDIAYKTLEAKLTGSLGGYKLSEFDASGQWQRDLYMDAPTAAGAQNIMEISMAGIAFSSSGYAGPYTMAWTIAGALSASRILSGILADKAGKASWNMATGAVTAKGASLTNPTLTGSSGGSETGHLNLRYNDGTGYAVSLGADGDLYLEFGAKLHVVQVDDQNNRTEVGYFDGSGWHGSVNTV